MNGLKYFRQISNLSLEDVSKKIGVTRSVISKWERGERNMTRENSQKLEKIFNIPSWYFDDDLDETEMLNLKKLKLQNDIVHSTREVKKLDGTTEKQDVSIMSPQLITELRQADIMIAIKSASNHIKDFIIPYEVAEDEEYTIDYINENAIYILKDLEIISEFTGVLAERKIPYSIIRIIFEALKLVYDCNNIQKYTDNQKLLNELCEVLLNNKNIK